MTDAEVSHAILHDSHPHVFRNRTSFPIIDYTYHRFVSAAVTDAQIPELSHNMGGVTFTNGELWKQNRSIGVKCMGEMNLLLHSISHVLHCTDEMIDEWFKDKRKGERASIDLGQWISKLGVEVVGYVVFGVRLGALSNLPSHRGTTLEWEAQDLVKCVRTMLDVIQKYIYVPLPASFFHYFKSPSIRKLDASVDRLRRLGEQLTDRVKPSDVTGPNATSATPEEKSRQECLAATLQR